MNEQLVAEALRTVSGDVPVGLPPVDAVVGAGHRRARNRRFAGAVAAAAGVGIIAATASLVISDQDDEALPADVNPIPVPWWGDGVLHLEHVTVPVAEVDNLVRLEEGVAYNTEDGDVVVVDGEGASKTVGQNIFSAPMAGSLEENWLAWVDPRDKAPQLVLYDVSAGTELGRVDLPYKGARWDRLDAGSHPISIDGGRVYYATQDGDWSWSPDEAEPRRETPDHLDLEDVRGGTRVWRAYETDQGWEERLSVTRPGFGDVLVYSSDGGGYLSPDGRYLVVLSGPGAGIFPVGSHDPVELDVAVDESNFGLNFKFADNDTVVGVVGGRPAPPSTQDAMGGPINVFPQFDTWDIVTCELESGTCTTLEDAVTESGPTFAE